jgi:acetolactate synthase-1/3 small subunit/acetolactate synthase II small subunit
MTERVVIGFDPGEGAVIRMLGLVERRGFIVRQIGMAEDAEGASLTIDVEPRDSSRRLEVLMLQLGRLHPVRIISHSTQGVSR